MILQLLTSALLQIEDPSKEVAEEEEKIYPIKNPQTEEDIVALKGTLFKKFQYENQLQSRVNLKSIETMLIKANHYSSDEDIEDFV